MKKRYIQPLTEMVRVRLFSTVLDDSIDIGPQSTVAGGSTGTGEDGGEHQFGDANAWSFDEDETPSPDKEWGRIGYLW